MRTNGVPPIRRLWDKLRFAAILAAMAGPALAGNLSVTVSDRDGRPVPDVAVFIETDAASAPPAAAGRRAVMDQVDRRFVPHLLVVQAGTAVEFPNSDTVAHHVYSFSHPNHFKLPLYRGEAHPPVTFEEPGTVILGCNIHDDMLAYILVVDTAEFAKTDERGEALLAVPRGAFRVSIWSPRIRDDEGVLSVLVSEQQAESGVAFRLEKSLRPAHGDGAGALTWSSY